MFIQTNTRHSSHYKNENRMAVKLIVEIFLTVQLKSPRVLPSSLILNECHLYCKIVKYCFLSKICMIKTVPHSSFTSDVMYQWYKRLVYTHPDLLGRFCKVNLSNAKNSCLIFFPGLINLRRSRAIMALKCDRS